MTKRCKNKLEPNGTILPAKMEHSLDTILPAKMEHSLDTILTAKMEHSLDKILPAKMEPFCRYNITCQNGTIL